MSPFVSPYAAMKGLSTRSWKIDSSGAEMISATPSIWPISTGSVGGPLVAPNETKTVSCVGTVLCGHPPLELLDDELLELLDEDEPAAISGPISAKTMSGTRSPSKSPMAVALTGAEVAISTGLKSAVPVPRYTVRPGYVQELTITSGRPSASMSAMCASVHVRVPA